MSLPGASTPRAYPPVASSAHPGGSPPVTPAATLGHEVVDAFYVRDPKNATGQLPEEAFAPLRAALRTALA